MLRSTQLDLSVYYVTMHLYKHWDLETVKWNQFVPTGVHQVNNVLAHSGTSVTVLATNSYWHINQAVANVLHLAPVAKREKPL